MQSAALRLVGGSALLFACSAGGPGLPVTTHDPPRRGLSAPATTDILPESASPISFARMAKFPEPGWSVPRKVAFAPDGASVTYLASERGDDEMALFSLDLATGARAVLLRAADLIPSDTPRSRAEELRAERQRNRTKGITEYQWAERAPLLLFPTGGDVFVRDGAGRILQLTKTAEPEIDPKPCADGSKVAFVRGRELHVVDVATLKETAITRGAPEGVTRGQSDFNGQEEFDEPSGHFWSPDCKKLAYLEVDERGVAEVPVLGHRGGKTDLMMQRYPRAGAANPRVTLHLADVASGKSEAVALPAGAPSAYLARLRFTSDSRALVFFALSRDQRRLALLRAPVDGGKKPPGVVHEEQASAGWLEMPDLVLSPSGAAAFANLARDGHAHLVRVSLDGAAAPRTLTNGDWDVARVLGASDKDEVYVTGNRDETLGRALHRVGPDGVITRLTPEPGVHDVVVSAKRGAFADVHSASARLPRAEVVREGKRLEIPVAADPDLASLGIRTAERIEVDVPGGPRLYGALLPPRVVVPGRKHPLVVMVYGGPGVQTVLDRWQPRLLWQHLADRGFYVLQVDNRGSGGRGPAFAAPIAGKLGFVELEDQLRALDQVLSRHPIDPARVALYGHSYGGYMAALAMLREPTRFRAAIAASPVTDWRLYDTGYTERFMGTPSENAAGYAATDLEALAANLRGELLVVHALMDENVHFQHSADLIDALVRAQKPFEMFVFPGERHGYRSPAAREYAMGLVTRFLVRALGAAGTAH